MVEADEKPLDLPPYPELINEAITALDNVDGSSKTEISEYIESRHKELPAGHSTLLAHHLNKMKESGELELINDNYRKAVPGASKKRGRGRPSKGKVPAPAGTPASSPRPRGRPPKPKVDVPAGSPLASPRPRGRPPKNKDASGTPKPKAKVSTGTPAKRGRPPTKKAKTTTGKSAGAASSASQSGVKRGRGRPPKAEA